MKRINIRFGTLLLLGFFVLTTNVFAQDPNFYIYLCFGQSNMEGQGAIQARDRVVDSRLKVLEAVTCSTLGRTQGSWYTAIPPLCRCWSGLSPADYFGRTMVANLPADIKVGIINVSVAGCKIELFDKDNYQTYVASITEDWLKNIIAEYGGNPYGRLVQMAKLAQKDGVIKGILLHQGESNTGDTQWPSKVKAIYNNLITDLSLDATKVPLFAGEVVNADQGGVCASMNSIIATLPKTLPNSYVISSAACTDTTDNIHFNSAGYRKLGSRYAVKALSLMGIDATVPGDIVVPPSNKGTESFWFEAEKFVTPTAGSKFDVLADAGTSSGKYITVQAGLQALTVAALDSASSIYIPFKTTKDTTYNLYARVNCPSVDHDSFWLKLDKGAFTNCSGLTTTGWAWLKVTSFYIPKGQHKIAISYRETGAMLDKICISSYGTAPTGMGESNSTTGIQGSIKASESYALKQNYPNPVNGKTSISFDIPKSTYVSLKIYSILGTEVRELAGKVFPEGSHMLDFDPADLPAGIYFYTLSADHFSASRKMIIQEK